MLTDWEFDSATGYYYDQRNGCHYDPNSGFYYTDAIGINPQFISFNHKHLAEIMLKFFVLNEQASGLQHRKRHFQHLKVLRHLSIRNPCLKSHNYLLTIKLMLKIEPVPQRP